MFPKKGKMIKRKYDVVPPRAHTHLKWGKKNRSADETQQVKTPKRMNVATKKKNSSTTLSGKAAVAHKKVQPTQYTTTICFRKKKSTHTRKMKKKKKKGVSFFLSGKARKPKEIGTIGYGRGGRGYFFRGDVPPTGPH